MKNIYKILLPFIAINCFAESNENFNCGDANRQPTLTTAHTIAGMICTLHANNMTEKNVRSKQNSFNFAHEWTVQKVYKTDADSGQSYIDGYLIEGVCSKKIMYYSTSQKKGIVAHPGYDLNIKIDRTALCNPHFTGTLQEKYISKAKPESSRYDQMIDTAQKRMALSNKRTLNVSFQDLGYRSSTSQEHVSDRILSRISLGTNIFSMLRSQFTGASINQGGTSESNLMGIGQVGFNFQTSNANEIKLPQFSIIKSIYQFNKSIDPSLANRDFMSISGEGLSLYIRQTGATAADLDSAKMSFSYMKATNVFYASNIDLNATVTMSGCTDYSYTGDLNSAEAMTVNDCKRVIQNLDY
jgi:hypothetical protein